MRFKKKPVKFYDTYFFLFKKIMSFRFSLETFSNLHCFIPTNFILKQTKWSNYQKSYNNNLNNETKLWIVIKKVPEEWT